VPHFPVKDMIANPGKTVSDSFYFVEDELIMQTKAFYSYTDDGAANRS
jgi:GMP-PDE, delta subunit